ncbi:MAG: hypothetical protein FK734_11200 [Asgard group archaeon]|nr:hypothetical protein [Asgard group archaeon]
MASDDDNFNGRSNGTRLCDITHFYNKQRSNSMTVYVEDPYLKDGRWLTSGSIRIVLTKYGEPNQVNAIKLTFAEATELIFRLQKGLELAIDKEVELQK